MCQCLPVLLSISFPTKTNSVWSKKLQLPKLKQMACMNNYFADPSNRMALASLGKGGDRFSNS